MQEETQVIYHCVSRRSPALSPRQSIVFALDNCLQEMLLLLRLLLPLLLAAAAGGDHFSESLRWLQLLRQLEEQQQQQQQRLLRQQHQQQATNGPFRAPALPDIASVLLQIFEPPKQRHKQQQNEPLALQQLHLLQEQLRSPGLALGQAQRRRLQGLEGWFWQQQQQQSVPAAQWLPLMSPPLVGMPQETGAPPPPPFFPLFSPQGLQQQQQPVYPRQQQPKQQQQRKQQQQQRQQQLPQHRLLQQVKKQQQQPERDVVEEKALNLLHSLQHLTGASRPRSSRSSNSSKSSSKRSSSKGSPLSKSSSSRSSAPFSVLVDLKRQMGLESTTTSTTPTTNPNIPFADESYVQHSSRALSTALDFGGALVQVIMRVPDFFAALEELIEVFFPREALGGGGPSLRPAAAPQQQQEGPLEEGAPARAAPADVRNAATAALQVVEFFAEIERALQLAAALQQQLGQLLQQQDLSSSEHAVVLSLSQLFPQQDHQQQRRLRNRKAGSEALFSPENLLLSLQQQQQEEQQVVLRQQQKESQARDKVGPETPEEAAANSVVESLLAALGVADKADDSAAAAAAEELKEEEEEQEWPLGMRPLPQLGAPLREWLASLQEFVSLAHSFFAAAQSILEITEEALSKLQLHNLLRGYNRMLRAGTLATLGIVSPGPPPETTGPPTVNCAQQGMTCCVPLAAAAGWQQQPVYLNGSNRGDCRAGFVSRANRLCASTPFAGSPCNIKVTHKYTPQTAQVSSSSSSSSSEGDPSFKVYTAVLPLPGYASAAVCQCEVSVHPNEDGLHTLQGSAAWDLQGGPSTDIIAESQHHWGYLKAFVKTAREATDILQHLADPEASTLQRVAQILTLVSKGGAGGGPQGPPAAPPPPPVSQGGPGGGGPYLAQPTQGPYTHDEATAGSVPISDSSLWVQGEPYKLARWPDAQGGPSPVGPVLPVESAYHTGAPMPNLAGDPHEGPHGAPLTSPPLTHPQLTPPDTALSPVVVWGPEMTASTVNTQQLPLASPAREVGAPLVYEGGAPHMYQGAPWPPRTLDNPTAATAAPTAAAAPPQGWRPVPPYY
ncbi:hypothetical protein Esti_004221 [Eimeria stiedai]